MVCVNIQPYDHLNILAKQLHVFSLLYAIEIFYVAFSIEREEPMELDTEQEEMEGKMQCYISIIYTIIILINVLNSLLFIYFNLFNIVLFCAFFFFSFLGFHLFLFQF